MKPYTQADQERDWRILHDAITETMNQFGEKNPVRRGDYWLLDDNWGGLQQQLEFQKTGLFRKDIIHLLQDLLAEYPDWYITIRMDVPNKDGVWPGMGVIIYSDEIVDELRRDFLPPEFRNVTFGTISTVTAEDFAERVRKLMKPKR